MKLQARYTYDCTPEQYWEMYWDDGFDAKLQKNSTVAREVIEESDSGDVLTRKLRFTPHAELPTAAAKIIGSSKLVWDQVNHWHRSKSSLLWEVLPTFISSDKFTAKGDFRVVPNGSGCAVEVDGEIAVKIRFIGGQIESQVVSQIKDAYDNMDRVSKSWLAENGSNS